MKRREVSTTQVVMNTVKKGDEHDWSYARYSASQVYAAGLQVKQRNQVFIGRTNASSCRKSRPKPLIQPHSSKKARAKLSARSLALRRLLHEPGHDKDNMRVPGLQHRALVLDEALNLRVTQSGLGQRPQNIESTVDVFPIVRPGIVEFDVADVVIVAVTCHALRSLARTRTRAPWHAPAVL